MAPSTRSSSVKFEQAPDGGWRVIENGTPRRLTREELNDMFMEVRLMKEALLTEKEELKVEMESNGEQYRMELQEKEEVLDEVATDVAGTEQARGEGQHMDRISK
jgi:hypothetical protein